MPAVPIPREDLSFLEVKRVDAGSAVASLEDFFGEAQPGDLLARIVLAAAGAGDGKVLYALRASFLEAAPPALPLTLRTSRLGADDRVERCEVRVSGARLLCVAEAGFETPAAGPCWEEALTGDLPDPDALPSTREYARREGWPEDYARGPLEFRRVGPLRPPPGAPTAHVSWLRPRQPLASDVGLHTATLAFASAFYPHWEFERRIGERFDHARFRLVGHALWIHRRVRFDDWWLMRGHCDLAVDGRALARRQLFTRDGRLIADASLEAQVATTA